MVDAVFRQNCSEGKSIKGRTGHLQDVLVKADVFVLSSSKFLELSRIKYNVEMSENL